MKRLKGWAREHLREFEFITLASIVLAVIAVIIFPQLLVLLFGGLFFWGAVSLVEFLIKTWLES